MKIESTKLSLIWKLLERLGYHGIKLFVQIILARILDPADFGVLAIILVFVDIATIFVQSGLNTALIQNKNSTEEDFSTILWISLFFSLLLYSIVFLGAPLIASYYKNNSIILYLRVIGLILIGGAINSIQIAYSSRSNNFRSQFICNLFAVIVSGIVAVFMAYKGLGIWALIAQQLIWQYLMVISMFVLVKWRPKCVFKFSSVKKMFSFGWKMLASSLLIRINTIASNLIIGKKYSTKDLGCYSKALEYPTAFSDVTVAAISSVALVDFSKKQEMISQASISLHKYIKYMMFFVAPIMFGLIAISKPFIIILLTDKWVKCVEYLRIFCLMYLFQPVCAIYGQAISGIGRNDLYLRTFVIVKPIGLGLIFLVSVFLKSPIYIAIAVVITSMIETIVQAFNVKKVFGIGIMEQVRDWIPSVSVSFLMLAVCFFCQYLPFGNIVILIIQVLVGIIVYVVFSYLIKSEPMIELLSRIKFINKRKVINK